MQVLVVVAAVWILWLPVCLLERAAQGDPRGVSIFPAIPLAPLMFWGLAELLDRLRPSLGLVLVGGAHGVLLVVMGASALRSWRTLRANRRGPS